MRDGLTTRLIVSSRAECRCNTAPQSVCVGASLCANLWNATCVALWNFVDGVTEERGDVCDAQTDPVIYLAPGALFHSSLLLLSGVHGADRARFGPAENYDAMTEQETLCNSDGELDLVLARPLTSHQPSRRAPPTLSSCVSAHHAHSLCSDVYPTSEVGARNKASWPPAISIIAFRDLFCMLPVLWSRKTAQVADTLPTLDLSLEVTQRSVLPGGLRVGDAQAAGSVRSAPCCV